MSFGLKALKKKQDHHISDDKRLYVKNLIVGDSTAAFYMAAQLHQKNEPFKLLTSKPTSMDSIQNDWKNCAQLIRGQENIELFQEMFPSVDIAEVTDTPVFYKDSDFKVFGGRSKSFELKEGEEFFSKPHAPFNEKNLFSEEGLSALTEVIEKQQLQKLIIEIEKSQPTDLVEPVNYKIHLSDHELIECENLYWSRSPKDLFKVIYAKEKFSEVFHKLVSKMQHKSLLKIRLPLEKKVSDHSVTVFLPQSVTHEWGHFICDFYEGNEGVEQYVNTTCFVEEEDATSEGLAKKIKLAKRVMARIFGDFKAIESDEQIIYIDNGLALNIDDELYSDLKEFEPNLFFIGESAVVLPKYKNCQFLMRSLASIINII
jgi:hypothetical protein